MHSDYRNNYSIPPGHRRSSRLHSPLVHFVVATMVGSGRKTSTRRHTRNTPPSPDGRPTSWTVCCARATTGHAPALPSPAMNARRRIGHASKPLCGQPYLGQGRMGTGCISPGGQLPATFFAARETACGPSRRFHNSAQVRCWSNRT
jgi:hypothetical protein